ncbi:MAG TPA: hypothetical protein VGG20_11865 [Thermoanaerobaculia bacterium]|jgi:hypothetical protein
MTEPPRGLIRFSPLDPRKVSIPHLPLPEEPAEPYTGAPPHEPAHSLRNFLYRTFMLPLIGLGFFVPAAEIPAALPGQVVQVAPSNTRKAAESQSLDALIRAHQSGLGDPDHPIRGESLARAIETVAEIPEKVEDKEDAIRSVLDAYATLETERGKTDEGVKDGLKKIREWQSLG